MGLHQNESVVGPLGLSATELPTIELPAIKLPGGRLSAIFGVVLTGGQSSRFSTDKALFAPHGKPWALIAKEALQGAGIERIFSVGGDVEALEQLGFDALPDDYPGRGPLGGVLTAMRSALQSKHSTDLRPESATAPLPESTTVPRPALATARPSVRQQPGHGVLMVLSCDLPWVSSRSVAEVLEAANMHMGEGKLAVLAEDSRGQRQYLHAAYQLSCLEVFQQAFQKKAASKNQQLDNKRTLGESGVSVGEALVERGVSVGEALAERGVSVGEALAERGVSVGEALAELPGDSVAVCRVSHPGTLLDVDTVADWEDYLGRDS